MKCTCSKDDLNGALSAVIKAVAVKPSTPVLAGIYLQAAGDSLELQATNFAISVVARVPANVEVEGATVVTGRVLAAVVQKFSGDIVTLTNEKDAATLELRSEAASFELLSMDAEDFPRINRETSLHSFRINKGALIRLINRTVFACAKDEGRPVFAGCFIDISGTAITFVATNTSRIAIARDVLSDSLDSLQFIVHAATLRNLLGMLYRAADAVVTVGFSGSEVTFSFDDIFLTSRIIDGAFPPYDKVIPASCATTADLDLRDLRAAVDRMQIIAREAEYQTLRFTFTQDGLELSSNSYTLGSSVEHLDSNVSGDDIELSLNFNFLIDALKAFDTEKVSFGMNQPLTPVKISPLGADDFTYIITPLRTQ